MKKKRLPSIQDVTDLKDKVVMVRASLNVPLTEAGELVDDFRVVKALKTIDYLQKAGARTIIIGHIGRDAHNTLKPIFTYLQSRIKDITFCPTLEKEAIEENVARLAAGGVVMLENLRQHEGEIANDFQFAEMLASSADIYVNDAFSVSHRDHASLVGLPKFLPSYAGLLFVDEFEHLSAARDPKHPAIFLLGGAKFATKQPLVEEFLDVYDHVFVGGALANDFYKAQGLEVGKSLVADEQISIDHLLERDNIIIPPDVTVLTVNGSHQIKQPNEVLESDMINDCGPKTLEELETLIKKAKVVLWNGPVGDYQRGFEHNTIALGRMIVASKATSIVGGGDTIALLAKEGLDQQFTFASSAGGAMLQFLLNGTLPGIDALWSCAKC